VHHRGGIQKYVIDGPVLEVGDEADLMLLAQSISKEHDAAAFLYALFAKDPRGRQEWSCFSLCRRMADIRTV
jgi:hypothetical protein